MVHNKYKLIKIIYITYLKLDNMLKFYKPQKLIIMKILLLANNPF